MEFSSDQLPGGDAERSRLGLLSIIRSGVGTMGLSCSHHNAVRFQTQYGC